MRFGRNGSSRPVGGPARYTQAMPLRIMVSRHSVFYSPLIATIAGGFLERRGVAAEYSILAKGQRSSALIRDGSVDILQAAVSSSWKPMEQGESPLPVHFAQINQRDGFFLVAREPDAAFEWNKLAGHEVLADHAAQPFIMLKYAARSNGVEWARVNAIDVIQHLREPVRGRAACYCLGVELIRE